MNYNLTDTKKIFLLILFLNLFIKLSYSQQTDYPLDIDQYNFIHYNKNILKFPKDSTNFITFFKKFNTLITKGEGKLNIIHIGGSHIQADIYTNVMRDRLQNFYPGLNGGRGLIFPYTIAKTNNPSNYIVKYTGKWDFCKNVQKKKHCTYGLTGYQIYTTDSISTIKIYSRKNYTNYEYNKVKIFHSFTDSVKYNLNIKINNVNASKKEFPKLGYTEFYFGKYIDTLNIEILKTDSFNIPFRLYGINLETDDPGIVYSAIGVNGSSIPSFLKCSLLVKNLKVINPDMVILSLGTNDAYMPKFNPNVYKANYDTLIQRILSVNKNTAIIITVPNDDYYKKRYPNKNTELQETVIFELAKKYDAAVWNLYEIMGGFNSSQVWYINKLMKRDRIHFTHKGYILKGNLFFNSFIKFNDNIINDKFINKYKSLKLL